MTHRLVVLAALLAAAGPVLAADAKPADARPAESKRADAKPADTKPEDTKPADARPAEVTPGDAKALEATQLVDTREFSARLPASARRTDRALDTAAGPVQLVFWMADAGETAVSLTYADYPESFAELPVDVLLDNARDGALGNAKARLVKEEKISVADGSGKRFEGRAFVGESPAGSTYRVTILFVGTRLYQLIAAHPKDAPEPPAYQELKASFRLK